MFTLIYLIWYALWGGYNLWGKPGRPFFGNELLAVGSFFMYLFLLKFRERMTKEDPWDRLTKFVAPVFMPYLIISVLMIHTIYVDKITVYGTAELTQINPLHWLLTNFGFPFAFYFIFLSYMECNDLLKSLKVIHKPLVISAFLVLISLFLWLYTQWGIFLFRGTPFYSDVAWLTNPIGPFVSWSEIEMIPALVGSIIAVANMLFLYRKLRGQVPQIKEDEVERYAFALFQFLTNISDMIGGTSITIFKSAIDGYNSRFGKNIKIEDTIHLSNIEEKEWPKFMEFVLGVFYMCIGPVTWEKAKGIEGLEEIVETARNHDGHRAW